MIKPCKYCGRTGGVVENKAGLNKNRLMDKCTYCAGRGYTIEKSQSKKEETK